MQTHELVAAEEAVAQLFNSGELPGLIHLSGGNEEALADIFQNIAEEDWVLGTHRAHFHFLLKGGTPSELLEEVKRGRSMFLFSQKLNFLTSSIVAGTPAIAVGLGMAIVLTQEKKKVWCFVGDGAEDEGHFYEAVYFAHEHGLPVTFIIEDNNRSVETNKKNRRGPNLVRRQWPDNVIRYHYRPTYPHGGTGIPTKVEFKPDEINKARKNWLPCNDISG